MRNRIIAAALGGVLGLTAGAALAQPTPNTAPFAIPNPTYVTLVLEIGVDRPAQHVWERIGKFCDIGEWLRTTCEITSGKAGELASVRRLGLGVTEPLVGRTDLSYTYTQPVRAGVPFNAYHGTLEVKPVTATTSKIVQSFFYDNSVLADDAARAAEIANRRARWTQALQNMKTLAEGGTLPPPPAPAR